MLQQICKFVHYPRGTVPMAVEGAYVMKKSLLVVGAITSIGVAGATGLGVASAATDTTNSSSSSLVDKIASKFNLNESDVQAVVDQDRSEHEAQRQAQMEKKLTQAVTDGKITSTQKDLILAKQKEAKAAMESDRDSMKDKTAEERKAAMDQKRTDLENWAKSNGIPTEYLRFVMGGHGGPHGDMGPGGSKGSQSADDAANTSTN